jgi:hypothetical protein
MSKEFDDTAPSEVDDAMTAAEADAPEVATAPAEPTPKEEAGAKPPTTDFGPETPQEFKSKLRSKAAKATFISWAALTVSVVTSAISMTVSYLNYYSQQDIFGREIVKSQYDIYYALNRIEIEYPQTSHLFALPKWYDGARAQVSKAAGQLDETKKAELKLRERAVARIIFTHYEQTVIQWDEASKAGYSERATLMEGDLNYYTRKVLPNPRLRYLWAEKGGDLGSDFIDEVKAHYEKHVLTLPNLKPADPEGPFGPD